MLETPAVLTDPRCGTSLFEQYAKAFHHLAGATLLRCWASQRMAGHYYSYRFRAYGKGHYMPFELTEAGAVFEFEGTDAAKLSTLLAQGVDALRLEGNNLQSMSWSECPFVPENGYGEMSDVTEVEALFVEQTANA